MKKYKFLISAIITLILSVVALVYSFGFYMLGSAGGIDNITYISYILIPLIISVGLFILSIKLFKKYY